MRISRSSCESRARCTKPAASRRLSLIALRDEILALRDSLHASAAPDRGAA
jgi:hypothetical protein